jgi:hypothetical protein
MAASLHSGELLDMPENQKNDNTNIIILINIAVLLLYCSVLKPLMKGEYDFLVQLACLAIHFVVCTVVALFNKPRAFLTSALIIFVVGLFTVAQAFFSH